MPRQDETSAPAISYSVVVKNIPYSLKQPDIWGNWGMGPDGNGGLTKIPYRSRGGGRAKSNDPSTWGSFLDAVKTTRNGHKRGLAIFMSHAAKLVGFDLDDCINESGLVHPAAMEYVNALNSYTEVTPSGRGLRVYVEGDMKALGFERGIKLQDMPWSGKLEVYWFGRFFTVTGKLLEPFPKRVRNRQDMLAGLVRHAESAGTREGKGQTSKKLSGEPSRHDEDLRLAGALVARGWTDDRIMKALVKRNAARGEHKLPDARVIGKREYKYIIDYCRTQHEKSAETFWTATPLLTYIRDLSRAYAASPLAVLTCVLAYVSYLTSHKVQLPPLLSFPDDGLDDEYDDQPNGSLNYFVSVVGESGKGKDVAMRIARMVLRHFEIEALRLGSGEGIAHTYQGRRKNSDGEWELYRKTHSAVFEDPEVATVLSASERKGTTTLPELCLCWSAGHLGKQNADPNKTLNVAGHTYRLAVIWGVQPAHAEQILEEERTGLPQRFVFPVCMDTKAGRAPRPTVRPKIDLAFGAISSHSPVEVMDVCAAARTAMIEFQFANLRGEVDPESSVHGHWLQLKLRTAGLLAILHGEPGVSDFWWTHAQWVMDRSNEGIALCNWHTIEEHEEQTERAVKKQARMAGASQRAIREVDKLDLCKDDIVEALRPTSAVWKRAHANASYPAALLKKRELQQSITSSRLVYFEQALSELAAAKVIDVQQHENRNGSVTAAYCLMQN